MANLNPRDIHSLVEADLTLIPLRDAKALSSEDRELGKAPRDASWTERDYSGFDAVAHMEAGGNVGVRLDGLIVADDDPRNHEKLPIIEDDPLARLVLEGMLPDDAPRVATGGGGTHVYMRLPADTDPSDLVESIEGFQGVEFKSGTGRQVVAPGSVHPSGRPYEHDFLSVGFDRIPEAPVQLLEALTKAPRHPSAGAGRCAPERLAEALDALDPEDFRDHDRWLAMMMACHHATEGHGRAEFVEWSTRDPEYADHGPVIGRRWDSLDPDRDRGVTVSTLQRALVDVGRSDLANLVIMLDPTEDFDGMAGAPDATAGQELIPITGRALLVNRSGRAADTIANAISAVARSGLDLAFDELKQRAVFTAPGLPWDEGYGRTLDDNTARLLRHFLIVKHQRNDFQPSKENVWEAVMTVAYEAKFNPVLDYLDALEWDGTPRVARLFPDYFDTEDGEYARAVSTCFMVAAVRRQRSPGCKFDTMPVLRSREQGKGKSTGLQALFGRDWFSDADLCDLKTKDAPLLLHGVWVQEFAELDGLRRADVNTLKAFCSRAVDRLRPPYGKGVVDMARRCVFVGTVNEGGYLKDGTGNRRFWPLTVRGEVDVAAIERDRDQIWAEAARLEAEGEDLVLPRELWGAAAERQAEQTSEDPWADTIRGFLEQRANDAFDGELGIGRFAEGRLLEGWKPPPTDRVHTAELFQALEVDVSRRSKDLAQKLRSVMEGSLGWTYSRSVRVKARVGAGYKREAD